jgi:hypothetical protein
MKLYQIDETTAECRNCKKSFPYDWGQWKGDYQPVYVTCSESCAMSMTDLAVSKVEAEEERRKIAYFFEHPGDV